MNERELIRYNMSPKERKVWNSFCRIISDKCLLMDTPPMNWNLLDQYLMTRRPYYGVRGYSGEDGYYEVHEGDKGELHMAIRTYSLDKAVFEKLIQIAHDMSYEYVSRNQKAIDTVQQGKWHFYKEYGPIINGRCKTKIIENSGWEYDAEYDYRKYWFELALDFLWKVLERRQLDLEIARYEGFMNHHFKEKFWSYDLQMREFVILKKG